jgi:hypothetical protein
MYLPARTFGERVTPTISRGRATVNVELPDLPTRQQWVEQRVNLLSHAIRKYQAVGIPVKDEWTEELLEHLKALQIPFLEYTRRYS